MIDNLEAKAKVLTALRIARTHGLRGYRVRVIADYGIFSYSPRAAEDNATLIAQQNTNAKVLHATVLFESDADMAKLFPENFPLQENPSVLSEIQTQDREEATRP